MTINQLLPNARGQADQGFIHRTWNGAGKSDNFVLDVQHTLSEQIAFWRAQGTQCSPSSTSTPSRMPLDNLSGLHATIDKLLWQGQYCKLPLLCNQELELFLSRKYNLSPVDVAASGDEFNKLSRLTVNFFVDEATSRLRHREIQNHE